MKIIRANSKNPNFNSDLLNKNTCFIVLDNNQEFYYAFEIIDFEVARIYHSVDKYLNNIIEEFLFYSNHISKIVNQDGIVLFEKRRRPIKKINLNAIQVSQFYISKKKLERNLKWIKKPEDIIIPIKMKDNIFISLDGHTRLKCAQLLGYEEVYFFEDECDDYIYEFVKMANAQAKYTIYDLDVISARDYKIKWDQFCDHFFEEKEKNK